MSGWGELGVGGTRWRLQVDGVCERTERVICLELIGSPSLSDLLLGCLNDRTRRTLHTSLMCQVQHTRI